MIGIAEAVALEDFSISFFISSGDGELPIPAGVPILSANIKSSRFMASGWSACKAFVGVWSEDFLSCAIPLGALLKVLIELFCLDNLYDN